MLSPLPPPFFFSPSPLSPSFVRPTRVTHSVSPLPPPHSAFDNCQASKYCTTVYSKGVTIIPGGNIREKRTLDPRLLQSESDLDRLAGEYRVLLHFAFFQRRSDLTHSSPAQSLLSPAK